MKEKVMSGQGVCLVLTRSRFLMTVRKDWNWNKFAQLQQQLAQWAMEHAIRIYSSDRYCDDIEKQQILTQVQEVFEARLAGKFWPRTEAGWFS